ncbi:hypothetical protein EYF80_035888 [Liparis tanakae]|uniref:Uncharacterized protein n=1 Tax=Liparis tanakae TaxID=230148 RepID=A0A4Z2GL23_9TELE|nr:hypothetical protein EYF80_035888 [Liparis tanakae]
MWNNKIRDPIPDKTSAHLGLHSCHNYYYCVLFCNHIVTSINNTSTCLVVVIALLRACFLTERPFTTSCRSSASTSAVPLLCSLGGVEMFNGEHTSRPLGLLSKGLSHRWFRRYSLSTTPRESILVGPENVVQPLPLPRDTATEGLSADGRLVHTCDHLSAAHVLSIHQGSN